MILEICCCALTLLVCGLSAFALKDHVLFLYLNNKTFWMEVVAAPAVKKKICSKQSKAGLTFAVSRVEKKLRQSKIAKQVGQQASVYLTGVVEHVILKLIEQAGEQAVAMKSKRVSDSHIIAAVRSDPDLARIFSGFCFTASENIPKAIDKILPDDEQKMRKQRKEETALRKSVAVDTVAGDDVVED